jgi:hypothetical protein
VVLLIIEVMSELASLETEQFACDDDSSHSKTDVYLTNESCTCICTERDVVISGVI